MRQPYLWVWVSAVVLASLCILMIAAASRHPIPELPKADTFFIGSSLTRFAIPPAEDISVQPLLDGGKHVRLALDSIEEIDLLQLVDRALVPSTTRVFVEIYPLSRDMAYQIHAQEAVKFNAGSSLSQINELIDTSKVLRQNLKYWLLSHTSSSLHRYTKPANFDQVFNIEVVKSHYPITLRSPNHPAYLNALTEKAKKLNIQLVLIALPRAEMAKQFQSAESLKLQEDHIREIADQFNIPLIDLNETWPDSLFIDQAHLNPKGRQQFVARLNQAWADFNNER